MENWIAEVRCLYTFLHSRLQGQIRRLKGEVQGTVDMSHLQRIKRLLNIINVESEELWVYVYFCALYKEIFALLLSGLARMYVCVCARMYWQVQNL